MSFYEPIKMKVSYGRPPARTGKDYGLPEEYADWEPWDGNGSSEDREFIRVTIAHHYPNGWLRKTGFMRLRAPKPRPVLPEVGPGAVLSFTSHRGRRARAVKHDAGTGWTVYTSRGRMAAEDPESRITFPGAGLVWTDTQLLGFVDDDGFTVELEGL